ncbi:hypothetical protein Q1695_006286 [Nippostrongylus brasiliensis]|nr:hypothetical protein Q1695_006286 [Nippostrongylus brasiliensis]
MLVAGHRPISRRLIGADILSAFPPPLSSAVSISGISAKTALNDVRQGLLGGVGCCSRAVWPPDCEKTERNFGALAKSEVNINYGSDRDAEASHPNYGCRDG